MPKLSLYNHFSPWQDGHYLAFNAASGALALMSAENHATYQQLVRKLSNGSSDGKTELSNSERELLKQLQYGQFVVDDSVPEIDKLKLRYRRTRYAMNALGMVIAPTMACNMACPYCFEDNKKGRMTPRVAEAIIDFVEKQAEQLDDVQITWYGGEPLLAFDIIEDISESMVDLANEYNFKYTCAGVITNGYLLDKSRVDRMAEMKFGQAQVTIDGPSRVHDQKRPLKNGRGSFETIITNLQYAVDKLPVVVRINLDKSFTPEIIEELLGELEVAGLKNKVAVYFGHLEPATPVCANISESCFETRAFSQTEIDYYRLLLQRGFFIQKLPQPIVTFCFAQLSNSFLIDPEGELYRCFNYAGDKTRSMGNVQQAVDYDHAEFNRLFAFDPFENTSCRTCDIMPLCMGSCPSRRLDRNVSEEEVCDSWKFNLEPMLELVALSRQQQARQRAARAAQETAI